MSRIGRLARALDRAHRAVARRLFPAAFVAFLLLVAVAAIGTDALGTGGVPTGLGLALRLVGASAVGALGR